MNRSLVLQLACITVASKKTGIDWEIVLTVMCVERSKNVKLAKQDDCIP